MTPAFIALDIARSTPYPVWAVEYALQHFPDVDTTRRFIVALAQCGHPSLTHAVDCLRNLRDLNLDV